MGLAAVNLNHLVALDALLRERSVGKAASRLGITQSALSHTLRSLRETTGDPLLVRVGNDMILTPFAEQAKERLQRGLADLESVVSGRAAFDPATITDTFTLATHDGVAATLAAPLLAALESRAPAAGLKIRPMEFDAMFEQLESGTLDILLLPPVVDLPGLDRADVPGKSPDLAEFTEFAVLCRRDHPKIRKRLTLSQYAANPHAVGSVTGDGPSFVDHLLAERGLTRSVRYFSPFVLSLFEVVAATDLILTIPRAMARYACRKWPLQWFPLPLPVKGESLAMWWHPRFSADPAHLFFREVIQSAVESVVAEG